VAEAAGRLAPAQQASPVDPGWLARTRVALTFGLADMNASVVALAGFLLRGGLVLLVLPTIVLPSVIDVAGATGVDAFGIDGHPTPWLFEIVAIASVVAGIYLILAFVFASLIDVWLIGAALDRRDGAAAKRRPLPNLSLLLDMAAIRAVFVLPVAAVVVWAGSQIYTAAYNELTTPSDLVTPLALRVIEKASGAVAVLVLAWLAAEVASAVAVRRLILLDAGVWRASGGALVQIVRRPFSTLATVAASFGASVMVIGLAMVATAATFDWCRIAARNPVPVTVTLGIGQFSTSRDFRPVVFILAAAALCLAWVAALALSGIASAWRSAALTGETVAAVPAADLDAAAARCGLLGMPSERLRD
jgi:hypothetical protein